MSHELRTPLTGVLGMADLVLESDIGAEQREHLGILKQSAVGLLSIVNDILDLSKIEAGQLELCPEVFSLRQCVEEALETLAAPAQSKGLELTAEWAPGMPAYVLGDALRLRQIVLNLLGNALKFTAAGTIRLTAACRRIEGPAESAAGAGEMELEFSVADTGSGIALEQQTRIFEAFRQADNSTTRRYGGTGLGLAICARLTAQMNGRIWVESRPGEGSVFRFTVRMREAAEAVRGVKPSRPQAAVHARGAQKILLVEDNLIIRKVVVGLLAKHGHRIDQAENGRVALDMLAVQDYDLVLMDVQMPEMDGLEATRRIRELERGTGRHLAVVGLTALAMLGDREACLEAGMDECVYKPIDVLMLLQAIEGAGSRSAAPEVETASVAGPVATAG
jgi:CheY-like chemotaxis protein